MMIRLLAFFILTVSFSATAIAQEAPVTSPADAVVAPSEKDPTYLLCKFKTLVRTLRVQTQNDGSCIATYTKEGVDKQVGKSWSVSRCSKVLLNIRDNLEKGNWKCKDISEARVSSSEM